MRHQTQLTGIRTESVDCGVRSLSMAIDWASRGAKIPSVRVLRERMGLDPDAVLATNPDMWEQAFNSFDTPNELGGKYEFLTSTKVKAGSWTPVYQRLKTGKAVILAIHYGRYRRLVPGKAGSDSFNGYHAVVLRGLRTRNGVEQTQVFDPLLDGRRPGIPKGPVWVPVAKLKVAAMAVGEAENVGKKVWALLPNRAHALGSGVGTPPPDPEEPEEEMANLYGVYADIADLVSTLSGAPKASAKAVMEDIESIIGGIPDAQAAPDTEPTEGAKV